MGYFNWISTASFITLNKRGVKTCFQCIIGNTKLIQHQFIKLFVFQLCRIRHSEKNKDRPIKHLKQKLSLENKKRRCYNDVYTSKTILFSLCRHAKLKGFSCLKGCQKRQLRVRHVYKILSLGI